MAFTIVNTVLLGWLFIIVLLIKQRCQYINHTIEVKYIRLLQFPDVCKWILRYHEQERDTSHSL